MEIEEITPPVDRYFEITLNLAEAKMLQDVCGNFSHFQVKEAVGYEGADVITDMIYAKLNRLLHPDEYDYNY